MCTPSLILITRSSYILACVLGRLQRILLEDFCTRSRAILLSLKAYWERLLSSLPRRLKKRWVAILTRITIMDISQLLNSDTEPSSSSREPARNPVSYYEETQTHQAVQRRSRFIDLVTAGHLDTDRISPSSGCITVQNDVALSGVNSDVNESDKLSYRATSSYLPHEDLIYSRTTSSPSETSRSPITSTSPSEKVGLVYQLPVGNISLHSRDSSCASRNMAPTRTSE